MREKIRPKTMRHHNDAPWPAEAAQLSPLPSSSSPRPTRATEPEVAATATPPPPLDPNSHPTTSVPVGQVENPQTSPQLSSPHSNANTLGQWEPILEADELTSCRLSSQSKVNHQHLNTVMDSQKPPESGHAENQVNKQQPAATLLFQQLKEEEEPARELNQCHSISQLVDKQPPLAQIKPTQPRPDQNATHSRPVHRNKSVRVQQIRSRSTIGRRKASGKCHSQTLQHQPNPTSSSDTLRSQSSNEEISRQRNSRYQSTTLAGDREAANGCLPATHTSLPATPSDETNMLLATATNLTIATASSISLTPSPLSPADMLDHVDIDTNSVDLNLTHGRHFDNRMPTATDTSPILTTDTADPDTDTIDDISARQADDHPSAIERHNRRPSMSANRYEKLTQTQLDRLSSLIKIIRNGDYKEFLELLNSREFKNLLNVFVDGQTALHYSLIHGRSLAWCKQLVLNGANPNLTNRAGWHPIHLAAYNGSVETMRYLIDCVAT